MGNSGNIEEKVSQLEQELAAVNRKLKAEQSKNRDFESLLINLSRAFSNGANYRQALQGQLEEAQRFFECTAGAAVFLADKKEEQLTCVHSTRELYGFDRISLLNPETLIAHAVCDNKVYIARAASKHPKTHKGYARLSGVESCIGVPFRREGSIAGVFYLAGLKDGKFYNKQELRIVTDHLALLLDIWNNGVFDPKFAGVYNKRQFDREFLRELNKSRKHNRSLSLILMDLDDFKDVNDSYGHSFGDSVLRRCVEATLANLREDDLITRSGAGDEFEILLSETQKENAMCIAENIRDEISALMFDGHDITVTASFGVAAFPEDGRTYGKLFNCADRQMYRAKSRGRNKVCAYSSVE